MSRNKDKSAYETRRHVGPKSQGAKQTANVSGHETRVEVTSRKQLVTVLDLGVYMLHLQQASLAFELKEGTFAAKKMSGKC